MRTKSLLNTTRQYLSLAILCFAAPYSLALHCEGPLTTARLPDLYSCSFQPPLASSVGTLLAPYLSPHNYFRLSLDGHWLLIQASASQFSQLYNTFALLQDAPESQYEEIIHTQLNKPEFHQRTYRVNPEYGIELFTFMQPLISQGGYLTYNNGILILTDIYDSHLGIMTIISQLNEIYK